MDLRAYGAFVAFAVVLVLLPGPDFALVVKNTLVGGRRGGVFTSVGVASSNLAQGTAAVLGLSALIVRSHWLFALIRWLGAAYLCYLGVQALVSAVRAGREARHSERPAAVAGRGWRQGFLSNITNPKVLVFYLSVLPQFVDPKHASPVQMFFLAGTHAVLSVVWLLLVTSTLARLRGWLQRRQVRRALHATTGTALLAFGARLAVDRG